jgi:predicted CopG family antitoxin
VYIHLSGFGDENMAVKTITIDIEAYKRLKAVQADRESFSQTIKRAIRPPVDVKNLKKTLGKSFLSNEAADAIEKHISQRHSAKRKR